MRVLLAVACLVAVFSQDQAFEISPGAKSGTFLNEAQTGMITFYRELFPDGQRLNSEIALGIMTARNDLCKISDKRYQKHRSIIMGNTCKKEFVKLYNKETPQPDKIKCSAVFCNVATNAETFLRDTLGALIAADTDEKFFEIIEDKIIDPMMEYSCRCLKDMLDAWINCKHKIGEADIWAVLLDFGGVDTSAEYLGGQGWKEFWVDVVVDGVPWENIKELFYRTMDNLCQKNTDEEGSTKCYTYFYDAFTDLYKVFLKATGKKPAVKKNKSPQDNGEPAHCTTYDLSAFSDMGVENITFGAIKDAVVDKFCVKACAPLYQKTLLGCCTASMIQDTALEEAVVDTAQGLADLVEKVALPQGSEEDVEAFDIAMYLAYYQDALEMLRDPTCDETDVSYDMTPCVGESADRCAGLKGKELKKCNKKQCEKEDDPCDGLKGKELKKCEKKQKKKCKRNQKNKEKKGGKGGAEEEETEGWVKVTRDTYIDFDPKNVPLEINTTSLVGSGEQMILTFYTAQNDYAGGLGIKFSQKPKYSLPHCSPWTNLKKIPDGQNRRWRIAVQDMDPSFRLLVLCNTVQVLNVKLSNSTCSESNWGSYWNDDVKKIYFNNTDTASVAYRPYTGWIKVEGSGYINQNMDDSPFKIKTISELGSNEKVVLNFYTNDTVSAGGLRIVFSKPPQYQLHECTNLKNFPKDLPDSDKKIWNIKVNKNKGIKVSIYCNKKLMVETKLSDDKCNNNGSWSEKWSEYMRKVRFTSEDTASKFYKPSREN